MNVRLASIAALLLAYPALAQGTGTFRVHGRVQLPEGCPAGEPVELLARRGIPQAPIAGALLASVRAEEDGAFELRLEGDEPGFYLVLKSRWLDLRPLWIQPQAGEHSIEVVLAPALCSILHGRFVHATDLPFAARDLAGSWVWIEGRNLHACEVDADGEFELRASPADLEGQLHANPRDFAPSCSETPTLEPGEQSDLLLPLVEPATLRGRVLGTAGEGLGGVSFSIWEGSDTPHPLVLDPWGDVQRVTSAADGSFEAAKLPPGDLTLRLEDPRWRTLGLLVRGLEPGEVREDLELVLQRAASLRGFVLDQDGLPVAGARVSAGSSAQVGSLLVATTDAQGRYGFDAAPPGVFVLSASEAGLAARSRTFAALLEGGRERCDLALERGTQLRIVLDGHAAPVHVRVTDALGFLRADQRVWQGELELTLSPGAYRIEVEGRSGFHGVARVVLTGRETGPRLVWP
ncbi:MAG: carboxypeptidase regulatory-like domain-containing protein [Planctomycetes bacterium]|nr:carboxypeptidase regulatory-like domain-containing protein [Planctomycetota bacterium]